MIPLLTWIPPPLERNLMVIPDEYRDKAVRIMLQSSNNLGTHPFHMHGHGFQVVATGAGPFSDAALAHANSADLRKVVVRNTVTIPANGRVVLQYVLPVISYFAQPVLT